jgi:hypothetical protein
MEVFNLPSGLAKYFLSYVLSDKAVYKLLKNKLWHRIDSSFAHRLELRPQRRGSDYCIYNARTKNSVFVTATYGETAGGHFSFNAGLSFGTFPTEVDAAEDGVTEPLPGSHVYVRGETCGLPPAHFWVELDWQTPSKNLVEEALRSPTAKPILAQLGVTRDERHHMLSYGIIESLGLKIPDSEFEPACLKFQSQLDQVLRLSIQPLINRLLGLLRDSD